MKYIKYFEMQAESGFNYSKIYKNEIREVKYAKKSGNDGGDYSYTGNCIFVSDKEMEELKNDNLISYLNFFTCYKEKDKYNILKKLNSSLDRIVNKFNV